MGGASNLDRLASGPLSSNHQEVLQETIRNFLLSVTKMILPHKKELSIEGTIGVSVDQDKVLLVHITEKLLKATDATSQEDELKSDHSAHLSSNSSNPQRDLKLTTECLVGHTSYKTVPALKPLVIAPLSVSDGFKVASQSLTSVAPPKGGQSSKAVKRKRAKSSLAEAGGLVVKGETGSISRNNGTSSQVQHESRKSSSNSSSSQQSSFSTSHFTTQVTESEKQGAVWTHKSSSQAESNGSEMLRSALIQEHNQQQQYHLRIKRRPTDSSGSPTTYSSMEMGWTKTEATSPLNLSNSRCTASASDNDGSKTTESDSAVKKSEKSSEADGSLLGKLLTGDLSLVQMQMAGISGKLSPHHLMTYDASTRYGITEKVEDEARNSPLETVNDATKD